MSSRELGPLADVVAPPPVPPSIEACGVGISYLNSDRSVNRLVEGVSLRLEPGAFWCIAGRSGSGKTSVLRVIVGLDRPSAGTVTWWSRDVVGMSEDELRAMRRDRIGYVDQSNTTIDDLTTLENVLIPALPDGRAVVRAMIPRARHLLELLGLGVQLHDSRVTTLSGGERQRTILARALLRTPSVLVVDEPTASLDRDSAALVIDVLAEHAAAGGAVIAASHDPHVLAVASDVLDLDP